MLLKFLFYFFYTFHCQFSIFQYFFALTEKYCYYIPVYLAIVVFRYSSAL